MKLINPIRLFVVSTSLSMVFVQLLAAQTQQSGLVSAIPGGTTANYYFAKPGDITILVDVWGSVSRPGRYEISTSIDLIHLVSLAGGPTAEAKLSEVRIARLAGIDTSSARKILMVNLEDLTRLSASELALFPGDLIVVERNYWAKIQDVFSFLVPVVTLSIYLLNLWLIVTR